MAAAATTRCSVCKIDFQTVGAMKMHHLRQCRLPCKYFPLCPQRFNSQTALDEHVARCSRVQQNCDVTRPNEADERGWTPLIVAASCSDETVCRELLRDSTVDKTHRTKDGFDALDIAEQHHASAAVIALLRKELREEEEENQSTGD